MSPDDVGAAARRLAAKMVADQQVPVMLSFVGGLSGELTAEKLAEAEALVVVARGRGKDLLVRTLLKDGVISAEREDRPHG